jgi:hypothetical protein
MTAFTAILNVIVLILDVAGFVVPVELVSALNAAAAAVISLIANAQMAFPVSTKLATITRKVVH